MTYIEFVNELQNRAEGFQRMWEEEQIDDPEGNPTDIEFREWMEEFLAYLED